MNERKDMRNNLSSFSVLILFLLSVGIKLGIYLAIYTKVQILFQFFKNDPLNRKDRLIRIISSFELQKYFSVKSKVLTRRRTPSYM